MAQRLPVSSRMELHAAVFRRLSDDDEERPAFSGEQHPCRQQHRHRPMGYRLHPERTRPSGIHDSGAHRQGHVPGTVSHGRGVYPSRGYPFPRPGSGRKNDRIIRPLCMMWNCNTQGFFCIIESSNNRRFLP